MRKIAVLLVVAVVALTAILLVRRDPTVYRPDDVTLIGTTIYDTGFALSFHTMDETLFYCPGVRFTDHGASITFEQPSRRRSSVIHYEFVRARVGHDAPVDIKAVYDKKSGNINIMFPFPDGKWKPGDSVTWCDSKGDLRGRVTNAGAKSEEDAESGKGERRR